MWGIRGEPGGVGVAVVEVGMGVVGWSEQTADLETTSDKDVHPQCACREIFLDFCSWGGVSTLTCLWATLSCAGHQLGHCYPLPPSLSSVFTVKWPSGFSLCLVFQAVPSDAQFHVDAPQMQKSR